MHNDDDSTTFTPDILGSVEFDLTEAIKDLIFNIKEIKQDVDNIKKQLNTEDKSHE